MISVVTVRIAIRSSCWYLVIPVGIFVIAFFQASSEKYSWDPNSLRWFNSQPFLWRWLMLPPCRPKAAAAKRGSVLLAAQWEALTFQSPWSWRQLGEIDENDDQSTDPEKRGCGDLPALAFSEALCNQTLMYWGCMSGWGWSKAHDRWVHDFTWRVRERLRNKRKRNWKAVDMLY